MGLNPQEYNKIREQAVVEAEAKAKEAGPANKWDRNRFEKVIDTQKEVEAFFETAYKGITAKLKTTGDPRLEKKLVELKQVYEHREQLETYMDEARADEYWNNLIFVLEKEERANLQHGPDLIKQLGLPQEVKDEGFETKNGEAQYILRKAGMIYYLTFKKSGQIEMKLWGINREMDFFKSESRAAPNERRPITQTVSLMELRDGSAFELFWQSMRDSQLVHVVDNINRSLGDLPKLSTDPKLKALIERRTALSALREEIYRTSDKNGDRELTLEQADKYFAQVSKIFEERLESYYAMDSGSEEAGLLHGTLVRLVIDHPQLYKSVLKVANTAERMQMWNIGYSRDPYLDAVFRGRKEELKNRAIDTNPALSEALKQLSETHKETAQEIIALGFLTGKDATQFISAFKGIQETAVDNFEDFIKEPETVKLFSKEPKLIIKFTGLCKGLNSPQFIVFSKYWLTYYLSDTSLKDYLGLVKSYPKFQDLEYMAIFAEVPREDPRKINTLVKRANIFMSSGKIDDHRFLQLLQIKSSYSDKALDLCENLDKAYLDDQIEPLISKYVYIKFQPADFKALNSLKPFQRKIFNFFNRADAWPRARSREDFLKLLSAVQTIETEDQMEYVLRRSRHTPSLKGFFAGQAVVFSPSEQQIIELSEKSQKCGKFWSEVQSFKEKNADAQYLNYELVDKLIDLGVSEAIMLSLTPELFKIDTEMQNQTVTALLSKSNAADLITQVARCAEKYGEFGYGEPLKGLYYKALSFTPDVKDIPQILDKVLSLKTSGEKLTDKGFTATMLHKAGTLSDLYQLIDCIKGSKCEAAFTPIYESKAYPDLGNRLNYTANLYLMMAVSINELKNPESIMPGLTKFLEDANKAKYNPNSDPDNEKAEALLDRTKILEKEDTDFTHIAFILNVILDSSPEFTKEKLNIWAQKALNSSKEKIREKAAKLLIGLGNYTNQFNAETVSKIAAEAVDSKISKHTISDDVKATQLDYIKAQAVNLPLSVYFSILINLEQAGKQTDEQLFQKLVDKYKGIENRPVYGKQVLVLAHDAADKTHSYFKDSDAFSPQAHEIFAELGGAKIQILRHGADNESVESMLSRLELTEGDLDIVIGGHGLENWISFGQENFNMPRLFERLEKRLKRQKSGMPWKTQIIFSSCYSSYNIEKIMEYWAQDQGTKDHPVRMLSSSSEREGSAKMAGDSWIRKAQEAKKTGEALTWGALYRDIESKNFIMSRVGWGNSNMTLYENGEKLF